VDDVTTAAGIRTERDSEPADARLVADAIADRARFAVIYERYRLPVYRYLRALGLNDDMAADLAASTFERALRSLRSYRGSGGGLGAWLLRIARNAYLNDRRRLDRLAQLEEVADLPAPGDGGQLATEIRQSLARLPAPTRDAIALRYTAGLTSAEIGRVLSKSPDAVQKLIERGLDTLKEALRDDR
jgi:RNA polymerase sigma-70 factor (ECF subfamily)